jgi:hypothetical protein
MISEVLSTILKIQYSEFFSNLKLGDVLTTAMQHRDPTLNKE